MPYKDKERQKEATRKAVQKHRKGITSEGITQQGITLNETEWVTGIPDTAFIKEHLGEDLSGQIERIHQYFIGISNIVTSLEERYQRAWAYQTREV